MALLTNHIAREEIENEHVARCNVGRGADNKSSPFKFRPTLRALSKLPLAGETSIRNLATAPEWFSHALASLLYRSE